MNLLSIRNNQITKLDNLTFSDVANLNSLDITYNNISRIALGTFSNSNIAGLYLSNNLLTKLENDTFAGLNQVHMIDLRNNKISTIEVRALNGLTTLMYIYLQNNNITELDNSTFSGCDNLYGIYLLGNQIASTSNLQRLCPTAALKCKVYLNQN